MEPTEQQKEIFREKSSCVVIAQPGSGKTFILAYKIKDVLTTLPYYKGVIAISYTNKASDELKRRCLDGGIDKKGSFFGTIDKFYISEIILPFGSHVFGNPQKEIEVIKTSENTKIQNFIDNVLVKNYKDLSSTDIKGLKKLFNMGILILGTVGILALYVFDKSHACRRYLKSKYSHIIIDEYQDAGKEQHELFVRLKYLGLCAIAVGDINQSIYAFSGKDSRYLVMLAKDATNFNAYPLTKNYRCHKSITDYSMKLLSSSYVPGSNSDLRVIEKHIIGSEIDIANWIDTALSFYKNKYNIRENYKVGILVRNKRTGDLIHDHLNIKHKYFISTPLDEDSSPWGTLFRDILNLTFNRNYTKYELAEKYIDIEIQPVKAKRIMSLLEQIITAANEDISYLINFTSHFTEISRTIYPESYNDNAEGILKLVLSSLDMIDSFRPASDEEAQLMTLHKSKGLEFDLVFHLDLYQWILPMYNGDYTQDLNLHYVGITRAKECCVLCTSSKRHNGSMQIVDANRSEFVRINALNSLRASSEV